MIEPEEIRAPPLFGNMRSAQPNLLYSLYEYGIDQGEITRSRR